MVILFDKMAIFDVIESIIESNGYVNMHNQAKNLLPRNVSIPSLDYEDDNSIENV